ncbi:conserved hypothetical protein [Ricinus communis]|uniref:Uncharacterized protein n=1 Tax=Ricinus communis TaxID=3988 RepID=B9S7R4_RICCO|nr:conserved hypothetical protein [Ricinus communis]
MVSGTALASASQWTWKATGLNQPGLVLRTEAKNKQNPRGKLLFQEIVDNIVFQLEMLTENIRTN